MDAKQNGNSKATGHPATWNHNNLDSSSESEGLTKREHFAAQAMIGLLAYTDEADGYAHDKIVPLAVKMADALLAELAKERP
jgi:hypothetical protein